MKNINIALIAHDNKKADMVAFVMHNKDYFLNENITLFATGTTGLHIENAGLTVHKLKSGPVGGDAQIAAKIVNGEIDIVLFFIDPLGLHPHEVDVHMLLRLCNVYNIPLATNKATAELILKSIDKNYIMIKKPIGPKTQIINEF